MTREELYQAENQEAMDILMEEYYYKYFRQGNIPDIPGEKAKPRRFIELIISPKCNLGCKYCYIHNHRNDIFNECLFDEENTLKNLKLLLEWITKNNFTMPIEIFSGELFAQEIGFKVFDVIYNFEKNIPSEKRIPSITVPTNFTFICSEELTKRIEDMYNKFQELGIAIHFSASIDGKYMEQNRPFVRQLDIPINVVRDDEYYHKAFTLIEKLHVGLHPMVYSKDIKKWKDNFLWFQEMMSQYNIGWEYIYLLQVRNEEWNKEDIKDFQGFIDFLYEFVWEKVEHDPERMKRFILDGTGFNLLFEPLSEVNRGYTCAIQDTLHIRVSDLMVYPCHRLGYDSFYLGQFVPDFDNILKLKCNNIEMMNAILATKKQYLPYCTGCIIKENCIGPCLGANYESNKNMFVTPPSVCMVMHALMVSTIKNWKKYGIYQEILNAMEPYKRFGFLQVEKELNI